MAYRATKEEEVYIFEMRARPLPISKSLPFMQMLLVKSASADNLGTSTDSLRYLCLHDTIKCRRNEVLMIR